MNDWQNHPTIARADGSYEISLNGLPYHVPNEGEWASLHAEITAFIALHPESVEPEVVHAPTPEEKMAALKGSYTWKIQQRLDEFARTKTYDNMLSACTYATSVDPVFAAEGQYCVEARDATWNTANALLQASLVTMQAGGNPPAWEEVEAKLPPLVWPAATESGKA